jgi:hypothetical protein
MNSSDFSASSPTFSVCGVQLVAATPWVAGPADRSSMKQRGLPGAAPPPLPARRRNVCNVRRQNRKGERMTVSRQHIADVVPPAIGSYWPGQGGIYAGVMPDYVGHNPQHLIFSIEEAIGVEWGGYLVHERGAASIYNGAANTRALVESKYRHPAAEWADRHVSDGHKDFHLPSRQEWDIASVTIPEEFVRNDWYWSSTEYSPTAAWGRNFNGVDLPHLFKTYRGRARAVRTIPA